MNHDYAASLLDDFLHEARAHIETMESAFLDLAALAKNPRQMAAVFRAAHSIKGTAGVFHAKKIVEITHALESIFSQIREGQREVDEEISDITLQSVDCLRDLLEHIDRPEAVDTAELVKQLRDCAGIAEEKGQVVRDGFSLSGKSPELLQALKTAAKHGHWAYSIRVPSAEALGAYRAQPQKLLDEILSVGGIEEAVVNGTPLNTGDAALAELISYGLKEAEGFKLELLATSVLEPELFLFAVELDKDLVRPISKKQILSAEAKDAAEAPEEESAPKADKQNVSIRLNISTVNSMMDTASEMIVARNRLLSATASLLKAGPDLAPVLHDVSRLTSEIQDKIMRTRMQPLGMIFGQYPRLVRDTARARGKSVQLEISGGEVALDKYLLDALVNPITQLVRNAIDHGIEMPERRMAMGKPPKGGLRLAAAMREGRVLIEVCDDGAGMDIEALKRSVLKRGLATKEQLADMPQSAVLDFVFEPGVSSAREVTELSGRGVGMDIVKDNIEKLGGSIEIASEAGKGTTMRLTMPLTLSIQRTLIVAVDGVSYAIPELNVERIVRVSAGTPSRRLERLDGAMVLNLDGWRLPVVTMEDIAARASGGAPLSAKNFLMRYLPRGVAKCLVLKTGGRYFTLLVDDALQTEETLAKPLPLFLQGCPCYSGVTVLGSGSAIVIMNVEGMLRFLGMEGAKKKIAAAKTGQLRQDKRQVILFRAAGAQLLAFEADKVSRVERIDASEIKKTRKGRFVEIRGKRVRVLGPEDYLPEPKRGRKEGKPCLLLLNTGGAPAGMLASNVLDRLEQIFPPSKRGAKMPEYVSARGVYESEELLLLDAAGILRSIGAGAAERGDGISEA